MANESDVAVWFDELSIIHIESPIVQENHYDPWGLNLAGIETAGQPNHKFQYLNREKQKEFGLNWIDLKARMYDPQLGRFHTVDPKPDEGDQESLSTYHYGLNNPVKESDPEGDCPNCLAAVVGAVGGALIGGGIEAGIQLIKHGEVKDWKAVGGAAAQGFVTGGVAGFTAGASLAVTVSTSAAANVAGGIADKTIRGEKVTAGSVLKDAALGAAGGAASKLIASKNILAKNWKKQPGEAMEHTLEKGKVVFKNGASNTTDADFVIKGGKVMIGSGHYAMSNGSKVVQGAGGIRLIRE